MVVRPRSYSAISPVGDDKADRMVQDDAVPLLPCPQCELWQYAHVSYVTKVCCVECGHTLNLRVPAGPPWASDDADRPPDADTAPDGIRRGPATSPGGLAPVATLIGAGQPAGEQR